MSSRKYEPHFAPSSPVGAPRAEWEPLEGYIQFWAQLAQEATRPKSLQGVGTAFLALSFEASAHVNYAYAWHSLWTFNPAAVAQTIEQTVRDLEEARESWQSVDLCLEMLATEEGVSDEEMQAAQAQVTHHSLRVSLLEQSVRIEYQRRKQQRFVQEIAVREVPAPPPIMREDSEVPDIGQQASEETPL